MKRLCCLPLAILTFAVPILGQSSPAGLYQGLAKNIKVLQGTLFLNLTAGIWKAKLPTGQPLVLRFAPNTLAQAQVDYQGGVLQSASLSFQPAIHIWVKDAHNGFSASIDSIAFDKLGTPAPHYTIDNGTTANPNMVHNLELGLRMSRTADGILLGAPFSMLGPSQACSDSDATVCSAPTPFISEVRFEKLDDAHPGLKVVLNDGANVRFSSKNANGKTFDNVITTAGASGFTFSQIDYTTDSRLLFAKLDDFHLGVSSGTLATKDVSLVLGSGSNLNFQQVLLNKNGASALIDATDGHLTALVGVGSSLNLSTGSTNPSNVTFANGSQVDLHGFTLGIDDAHKTIFKVGGGSTVSAQIASAHLGIGSSGFLSFSSGALAASLLGEWDSAADDGPQSDLEISLLDATVDGGVLDLNQDTHLKVASGAMKATNLVFRSFEFAGLVGKLSTLNLALQGGSHFGVPGGFQVVTAPGATLVSATPADPLMFASGGNFPTGTAALDLPFTELRNAKLATFLIRNGSAHILVANRSDGSIDGNGGSFTGTGTFASGDLPLTAVFNVSNVTIAKAPGKTPLVTGIFNGSIRKADFTYTSSPSYHNPGHDNLRIYPVTAELKMNSDLVFPPSRLTFDNLGFSLTSLTNGPIDIPVNATLIVPNGRGEHQQPDDRDDTADGTHGGSDDEHHWQEIITDTEPGCRVHLYAVADSYATTAQFHLLANAGTMSISFDHVQTDHAIRWDKDGCSLQEMLPIVGAIVGTVFGGPAGTALGVAAGLVAGGDLDNMIAARVDAVIVEKIQGLQGSWRFQL